MNPHKLVFVYNATSGKVQAWLDVAHKVISPSTYPCKLCNITYGIAKEDETWKKFRESSAVDMLFLHSDEFEDAYGKEVFREFKLPVLLEDDAGHLKELISAEDFKKINSSLALIKEIKRSSAYNL